MPAVPLKILTANRLLTGDVLYWRAGRWIETLTKAEIFADEISAETALAQAQSSISANQVVSPYLFDVRQDKDGPRPVREREIIRSLGPSVRPDTGKQASHVQV
jgi:hypothetical protein